MIKKYSGNMTGTGMSFYMPGGELARSAGPVYAWKADKFRGTERKNLRLLSFKQLTNFLFTIK